MEERILARGHENILATHKTTLEITCGSHLSRKGNCIIAVSADKSMNDLNPRFRQKIRGENARVTITIRADDLAETVDACGSRLLVLDDPSDMVVRKSGFICNRTLAIQADKAACDLSRELVQRLRNPAQKVEIILTVRT